MASEKTNLQRHLEYLQARRSGAEFCLNLVTGEENIGKIKKFINNLSTSIQENGVKLATIEQAEERQKKAKKAQAEAAKKARQRF